MAIAAILGCIAATLPAAKYLPANATPNWVMTGGHDNHVQIGASVSGDLLGQLERSINKKDMATTAMTKRLEQLIEELNDRCRQPALQPLEKRLSQRAAELLRTGEFDQAATLLSALIAQSNVSSPRWAQNHYDLGEVYDLQFQPSRALPYYEIAYQCRPDNVSYALGYASALKKANRYPEAETVYVRALRKPRRLTRANLYAVANILNDIGVLYLRTNRVLQAEIVLNQALAGFRRLSRDHPDTNRPYLSTTLINLGLIYGNTQRPAEAEAALGEAVTNFRQLAKENPVIYQQYLVAALSNARALYLQTQHYREAEAIFTESLSTCRLVAAHDPGFLPDEAGALYNLAMTYCATGRMKEAGALIVEALPIFRQSARVNPNYFP